MAFCRVFLELHSGLPSCSKFQRVECKFKSGRKLRLNPISILEDLKKSQENRRHLRTMAVMKPPRKDLKIFNTDENYTSIKTGESLPLKLEDWKVVPDIWITLSQSFGNSIALHDPHRSENAEISFQELHEAITNFGEGLRVLGISKGDCVALFSENSARWLIADQGVMALGAHNAVRGSRSSTIELVHIIKHSESKGIIVENDSLKERLLSRIDDDPTLKEKIKFCIVLWEDAISENTEQPQNGRGTSPGASQSPIPVYSFGEIIETGRMSRKAQEAAEISERYLKPFIHPNDLATIVYTSGTSGNPKGVMLSHANLMHQVRNLEAVIRPNVGDTVLSLLPPWHMYERSAEYFVLSRGLKQIYSSVKTFKEDLVKFPPDFFIAVPLVFESLYNAVQKKLAAATPARATIAGLLIAASLSYAQAKRVFEGKELGGLKKSFSPISSLIEWIISSIKVILLLPVFLLAKKMVFAKIKEALGIRKLAVSGGGSLPAHVDQFFAAIDMPLLNGYGLTETSPVLTARTLNNNILGTVGVPLPETEIRIVDPVNGVVLPVGIKGVVQARGPQIMIGYFKNPAATASVMDADGFFNTGDLGWLTPHVPSGPARNCGGLLVLDGRAKDTIVMANGENVEPSYIEEIILQSKFVSQVMVVGQDRRRLGAIIVPNKEILDEKVESMKKDKGINWMPSPAELKNIVHEDISKCFRDSEIPSYQHVGPIAILTEPFTIENSLLTATMKMRREQIRERFAEEIKTLYN